MLVVGGKQMYSREQLEGVLLGKMKLEILAFENKNNKLGYGVKLGIKVRGDYDFLEMVSQSILLHWGISLPVKEQENKTRKSPVISTQKLKHIEALLDCIPDLPDSKGELGMFREAFEIIINGEHKYQEGFDAILEIKELI